MSAKCWRACYIMCVFVFAQFVSSLEGIHHARLSLAGAGRECRTSSLRMEKNRVADTPKYMPAHNTFERHRRRSEFQIHDQTQPDKVIASTNEHTIILHIIFERSTRAHQKRRRGVMIYASVFRLKVFFCSAVKLFIGLGANVFACERKRAVFVSVRNDPD